VSGQARHLRERPSEGAAGFVGEVTGGIAQFVPSFFSPIILGATVADHADETMRRVYDETGDPVAAMGSGVIQGVAELAGFQVAGHVLGKRAAKNVGDLLVKGDTRAAARAIGNLAGGGGAAAGIGETALILDELQQAWNVEERTLSDAWERIKEKTPETVIGHGLGGVLMTGTGGGAAAIRSWQFRRAINRHIDAIEGALRTGRVEVGAGRFRPVDKSEAASIRETLRTYAKDMEQQGFTDIAVRARRAAEVESGKAARTEASGDRGRTGQAAEQPAAVRQPTPGEPAPPARRAEADRPTRQTDTRAVVARETPARDPQAEPVRTGEQQTTAELAEGLAPQEQAQIRGRVDELGSIEAVREAFPGESRQDQFAMALAQERFLRKPRGLNQASTEGGAG
jgi:hypothetical protein